MRCRCNSERCPACCVPAHHTSARTVRAPARPLPPPPADGGPPAAAARLAGRLPRRGGRGAGILRRRVPLPAHRHARRAALPLPHPLASQARGVRGRNGQPFLPRPNFPRSRAPHPPLSAAAGLYWTSPSARPCGLCCRPGRGSAPAGSWTRCCVATPAPSSSAALWPGRGTARGRGGGTPGWCGTRRRTTPCPAPRTPTSCEATTTRSARRCSSARPRSTAPGTGLAAAAAGMRMRSRRGTSCAGWTRRAPSAGAAAARSGRARRRRRWLRRGERRRWRRRRRQRRSVSRAHAVLCRRSSSRRALRPAPSFVRSPFSPRRGPPLSLSVLRALPPLPRSKLFLSVWRAAHDPDPSVANAACTAGAAASTAAHCAAGGRAVTRGDGGATGGRRPHPPTSPSPPPRARLLGRERDALRPGHQHPILAACGGGGGGGGVRRRMRRRSRPPSRHAAAPCRPHTRTHS